MVAHCKKATLLVHVSGEIYTRISCAFQNTSVAKLTSEGSAILLLVWDNKESRCGV